MANFLDLTGKTFGRLKVLGISRQIQSGKRNRYYWNCICKCGNKIETRTDCLTSGNTKSCGCLLSEQALKNVVINHKHKMSGTRLYKTWQNMKKRCINPKDKSYVNYGGRGIKVCDEWSNSFEHFMKWALSNGYSNNLTIDRIDVSGNYEPSNCRWSNDTEQARNRRSNVLVNYKGKEITLIELSEITGIEYGCLSGRYERGDRGKRLIRNINEDKNVPKGSIQHLSKLTEESVSEIKALLRKGVLQKEIAKRYKVSPSAINSIARNRTWKHIK
ncbi:hypothetical protein KQI86_19415 [Clostridium sp. MSJ-11]|uniref:Uncharacterized protein n=1 Tax=Clostridium mobile TaxID=2841512 RepID=A0ABS6EML6_9CLOT|nr:hypothetical protein [Clostridium mobile]MBU5486473.1 hypothetical protein [Clostridium mobile]